MVHPDSSPFVRKITQKQTCAIIYLTNSTLCMQVNIPVQRMCQSNACEFESSLMEYCFTNNIIMKETGNIWCKTVMTYVEKCNSGEQNVYGLVRKGNPTKCRNLENSYRI